MYVYDVQYVCGHIHIFIFLSDASYNYAYVCVRDRQGIRHKIFLSFHYFVTLLQVVHHDVFFSCWHSSETTLLYAYCAL